MSQRKAYIPEKRFNPAEIAKQQEIARVKFEGVLKDLKERTENHSNVLDALANSHATHITYLANFAKHDIKNALLSMSSIFATTSIGEFDEDIIKILKLQMSVIKDVLDNFSKLVPHSENDTFEIEALMIATQVICRSDLKKDNVELTSSYDRTDTTVIHLPFQSVFQVLHNLILNSIKALEGCTEKKITITATISDNLLNLKIFDSGTPIPAADKEKVFNYGYSSTGGSGIGLFHARYLCNQFHGSIVLIEDCKTFVIKLPLNPPSEQNHVNN